MATDIHTIPIGGDCYVELTGLYDELSETYINNATVTGQLYTMGGTAVGSAISFAYKAASNGIYQASIPASTTTSLNQYQRYLIRVTGTTISGLTYKEDVCAVAGRSED